MENMGDVNIDDLRKLHDKFAPTDLEWRVQSCGERNGKIWAVALCYVTNRAIMNRLDKVVKPHNWKNEYSAGPHGGVMCGISIKINGEWITKFDGADNTAVESVKGGFSDSMKRAAVQWGVGRYLYNLEASFADVTESGVYRAKTKDGKSFRWNPPRLPVWALPHKDSPTPTHPSKADVESNE